MIESKPVTIELTGGGSKVFLISKFDAISGRRIVTQYPSSGIPKLGDYATNEAIMLEMMGFVAVETEGGELRLDSRDLVINHVPDWECLARLEWALMEYNCSFFGNGRASSFLEELLTTLPESIMSILTPLLVSFSQKSSPPSEN